LAESSWRNLLFLQGATALIGLLAIVPGQVRVMAVVIAGLLSFFSFVFIR
jgi:hypothetical protein